MSKIRSSEYSDHTIRLSILHSQRLRMLHLITLIMSSFFHRIPPWYSPKLPFICRLERHYTDGLV